MLFSCSFARLFLALTVLTAVAPGAARAEPMIYFNQGWPANLFADGTAAKFVVSAGYPVGGGDPVVFVGFALSNNIGQGGRVTDYANPYYFSSSGGFGEPFPLELTVPASGGHLRTLLGNSQNIQRNHPELNLP